MGLYHLEKIFEPAHVAVIGASPQKGAIGHAIVNNLITGGYEGQILPVNPKHREIEGIPCVPSIGKLNAAVDLAVIATPIATVAGIVRECVEAGVKTAIIISAGGKETGDAGQELEAAINTEARKGGLRIVGPNCMGIIRPKNKLNASFAARMPYPGKLAFISQSGAICAAMLDLSLQEQMGFSYFISIGSMLDVDFGDLVDYLGNDPEVSSILLYVESLTNIRKFMSAAREVSRIKPIVVLKAGRSPAGAKAAASHTGALAGEDAVYDAAFRRAGIVRVHTLDDFFDCAELLAKQKPPTGPRLVVITNSGGPGVMAADAATEYGLQMTQLSEATLKKLDDVLPPHWSRNNPIDILGDAGATRYVQAVECCLEQRDINGMLVILNPQAMIDPAEVARTVAKSLRNRAYPIFAAWMGGQDVEAGIAVLNREGIPTYSSPERALRAFRYLYHYATNLDLLQQIPSRMPPHEAPNKARVAELIQKGLKRSQGILTEVESKEVLACYGIPVNPTHAAGAKEDACALARKLGFALVMKLDSTEITHKTEAGGVKIDLQNEEDIQRAWDDILAGAKAYDPDAAVEGVSLQPMLRYPEVELLLGAKRDPQFGPVILFGQGGILAEIHKDRALSLAPLNQSLARRLMQETRIFRALEGYRNLPVTDLSQLEQMLVALSHLLIDFPEIAELDLNPVMVVKGQPVAVDARIIVQATDIRSPHHLVISPYPQHYESALTSQKASDLRVRPIKPEDAPLLLNLFDSMSAESRYYRFFSPKQRLSEPFLVRLTQLDYDRHIALVALTGKADQETMIGVVRLISDPDRTRAEFSMVVADDWHGQGVGRQLMERILKVAADYDIQQVRGLVLAENKPMLALGRKFGFDIARVENSVERELTIDPRKPRRQD